MAAGDAAVGAFRLHLDWSRIERAARELDLSRAELRRAMRVHMTACGKIARAHWRGLFVGTPTDKTARRRRGGGPNLGRFTGRGLRSIGIRTKFPRETSAGKTLSSGATIWKTYVGPRGGAGIPKPGFYLAFHEFGTKAGHPARRMAGRTRQATDRAIQAELERVTVAVLRGW